MSRISGPSTRLGMVIHNRFGRHYRRPSIWCILLPPFHHDWQPVGGIPFRGKKAITPMGNQMLWCMDCHGEKLVWPWGDWKPEPGETFGYSGGPRSRAMYSKDILNRKENNAKR